MFSVLKFVQVMEEEDKLPLKRVEVSLTKFNEVAIPHHLDLLRQHKANILKHERLGQYGRMSSDQARAARVAKQLRGLLDELSQLRQRVRSSELSRFDALTSRSRDATLKAIVDYLETIERSCRSLAVAAARQMESPPLKARRAAANGAQQVAGSVASTDSVGILPDPSADQSPDRTEWSPDQSTGQPESVPAPQIQLLVDHHELSLREREAVLAGWDGLQSEMVALHEAWLGVAAAASAQRALVAASSESVEVAAVNVAEARKTLSAAEKLRLGAMGVGGAALGALVGGPVGLVVGVKAGAAAALAGGALGFFATKLVAGSRDKQLEAAPATEDGSNGQNSQVKPKSE